MRGFKMKRKILATLTLMAALVILPLMVWAAPVGKITLLEGQADVTIQGVTKICHLGEEVAAGDIVRTKKNSRVIVTLVDGNTLSIGPLTRMRIAQYEPKAGAQNYCDLFRGKTRVVMNTIAKGASFEIRTPTAVAGVRGTIFVGFYEQGRSGFIFERGEGYGYNRRMPTQVVKIEAGQIMEVPRPEQPPVVRPVGKNEVERHVKDITGGEEGKKEEKKEEKKGEAVTEKPVEAKGEVPVETKQEGPVTQTVMKEEAPPAVEAPPAPAAPQVTTVTPVAPVEEKLPEPPPPVPTPTTANLTEFTPIPVTIGDIQGSLTGAIDATTGQGSITFTAQGAIGDFDKRLSGSLKDGSSLEAYLSGITGSWRGIFYGLAQKGSTVSLLEGYLKDANYTGSGTLSATGTLTKGEKWSSSASLAEKTLYLPYFTDVLWKSSLGVKMEEGSLYGYEGDAGKIMGIWSSGVKGGCYSNDTGSTSWSTPFVGIHEGGDVPAAAVAGQATVTDDGAGHVGIKATDVYYMDSNYFATGRFSHEGVYEGSDYRGVTAGTWVLTPLTYGGIYQLGWDYVLENVYGGGLLGGTSGRPWEGKTDLKILGEYNGQPEKVLMGQFFGSSNPSGDMIQGYTLGLLGDSAYTWGIYATANGAGLIKGDDLTYNFFSLGGNYGMWRAEGHIEGEPMDVPPGFSSANWTLHRQYAVKGHLGEGFGINSGEGYFETFKENSSDSFLPWGIYRFGFLGTYSRPPDATSWSTRLGGEISSLDEKLIGYFLGEAAGQWKDSATVTGNFSGRYLTQGFEGVMVGPLVGADEKIAGLGNYAGTPLTFSAGVGVLENNGFQQWTESGMLPSGPDNEMGSKKSAMTGLLGGTEDLWSQKANFKILGKYDPQYKAPFWFLDFTRRDPYLEMHNPCQFNIACQGLLSGGTKFEGVGYYGGIAGTVVNDADLIGQGIALYIKPAEAGYEAGYLRLTDIMGSLYDEIDMWEATGQIEAVKKGTTTITPEKLYDGSESLERAEYTLPLRGDLSGYIHGMALRLADQPWSISLLNIMGDAETTPTGSWSGRFGKAENSQDGNFWANYVVGKITGNGGSGTITGQELNIEPSASYLATLTGGFKGAFNSQGQFIGGGWMVADETSLTHGALYTKGNLAQVVPGKIVIKAYVSPYYAYNFSWNSYEVSYFQPEGYTVPLEKSWSFETKTIIGNDLMQETFKAVYYPSGKWITVKQGEGITHVVDGGVIHSTWDLSTEPPRGYIGDNLSFVDNPYPGTSTFTYGQYVSSLSSEWTGVNGLLIGNNFTGALGVLPGQDLWSSGPENTASMVMMGTHGKYSGNQLFFTQGYSVTGTGAFVTDATGIIREKGLSAGNPLDGLLIGFYGDNAGKVGVLKGEYTGYSYPDLGMWETEKGSIYRDGILRDKSVSGINSENLKDSLVESALGIGINNALYGTFDGGGYVKARAGIFGHTYHLSGEPDWGIFRLTASLLNSYDKPAQATSWEATLFGNAGFGRDNTYVDLGYWYANLTAGSWQDGKLTGNLAGEFLTLLKKGVIEGKLLGGYDGNGSWQAVGAGTWRKEKDVYFGSEIWGQSFNISHVRYGNFSGDGYSYGFSYNNQGDLRYGAAELVESNGTKTHWRLDIFGPPEAQKYSREVWKDLGDGNFTYKIDSFDSFEAYTQALSELEKDPKTGSPIPNIYNTMSFVMANFSGVFAGLENLWPNIGVKGTPVSLLGHTNFWDQPNFDLFRAEVVSVNPLVTIDPYLNSRSRVWTEGGKDWYGAYGGFLGGRYDTAAKELPVMFQAFYLDQDGNFGLLYTDSQEPLTGTVKAEVGMWKADGNIYGYPLGSGLMGVSPDNFVSNLMKERTYPFLPSPVSGDDVLPTGNGITLRAMDTYKLFLPYPYNNTYSIGELVAAGNYSGTAFPTSWTWGLEIEEISGIDVSWILANSTAVKNNTFDGKVVEAHMYVGGNDARTYVAGGEIKGLYDPAASTWKAVVNRFEMETGALISKLNSFSSDEERAAFQKATRIPAFEVGRTNLTGSWSESSWSINMTGSYGMKDVVFLAPSTGARPQIWATGNVSGAFTGTPPSGATVPLKGSNDISANFVVKNWTGSQWGALVVNGIAPNGIGSYNSSFNFKGVAAGNILPASGQFNGTAAGIVPSK